MQGIDDTVSMELGQYADYVYYVFAIIFGLYFLDGAYYLLVALLARIAESLWPIVGDPSYRGSRHEAHKMEAAQRAAQGVYAADDSEAASRDVVAATLSELYDYYPLVLVQLYLGNDEVEAQQGLFQVASMHWPRERLILQVCDDSTLPGTTSIIEARAQECRALGYDVQLVQRPDRQGGKHGALAAGLALARSLPIEYIAVFDGGASPPADFLLQTVHHLMANGKLGLVQAGSVISNRGWGPLKWVQAVALKWHAAVEQRARGFDGGLVAYDGTAAVWRLATITECGGLAYDTGASDLDLALRVYLSGWELLYLPHVRVPARMSPAYSRLRRQIYQAASGHTVMYKRYSAMVWAGGDKRVGLRARLGVWHYLTRQLHCLLVALALLALPPVLLYVAPWQQHYRSLPFLVFAGSAVAVVLLLYLPITLLSPAYQIFSATSLFYKCCGLLGGIFGDGRLPPRIPDDTAPDSCFKAACRRPYFTELLVAMYFSGWSIAAWLGPMDIAVGSYSALMALVCLMLSFGQYFCPVKRGPDTGYSAQQGDVYRQYQLKLVEQYAQQLENMETAPGDTIAAYGGEYMHRQSNGMTRRTGSRRSTEDGQLPEHFVVQHNAMFEQHPQSSPSPTGQELPVAPEAAAPAPAATKEAEVASPQEQAAEEPVPPSSEKVSAGSGGKESSRQQQAGQRRDSSSSDGGHGSRSSRKAAKKKSRKKRATSSSGTSSSGKEADGGSSGDDAEAPPAGKAKAAKMEVDTVRGSRAAPPAPPAVMYVMSQQPVMVNGQLVMSMQPQQLVLVPNSPMAGQGQAMPRAEPPPGSPAHAAALLRAQSATAAALPGAPAHMLQRLPSLQPLQPLGQLPQLQALPGLQVLGPESPRSPTVGSSTAQLALNIAALQQQQQAQLQQLQQQQAQLMRASSATALSAQLAPGSPTAMAAIPQQQFMQPSNVPAGSPQPPRQPLRPQHSLSTQGNSAQQSNSSSAVASPRASMAMSPRASLALPQGSGGPPSPRASLSVSPRAAAAAPAAPSLYTAPTSPRLSNLRQSSSGAAGPGAGAAPGSPTGQGMMYAGRKSISGSTSSATASGMSPRSSMALYGGVRQSNSGAAGGGAAGGPSGGSSAPSVRSSMGLPSLQQQPGSPAAAGPMSPRASMALYGGVRQSGAGSLAAGSGSGSAPSSPRSPGMMYAGKR